MGHRFVDLLKARSGTPAVVAHRGDSFHAPENTLEACRLGWEAGAEAWELDVQLTRDGVPVVLHDESLARTTDVAERFQGDPRARSGFRLIDFDWEEVRTLDAGRWFVSGQTPSRSRTAVAFGTLEALPHAQRRRYESGAIRIPALREALALTADLDWLVNVELKSFPSRPPGLLEAVVEAVAQTGTADRVLLSSFDHEVVARAADVVRQSHPELSPLPRGILVGTPLHRPERYLRECLGAETYHASAESLGSESIVYRRRPAASALRTAELAALQEAGFPVLVYTVNDHAPGGLAQHLASLGVRGLFTDDPAGLRTHLAEPT